MCVIERKKQQMKNKYYIRIHTVYAWYTHELFSTIFVKLHCLYKKLRIWITRSFNSRERFYKINYTCMDHKFNIFLIYSLDVIYLNKEFFYLSEFDAKLRLNFLTARENAGGSYPIPGA